MSQNPNICGFCTAGVDDERNAYYLTQADGSSCLHQCHQICVNQYVDNFALQDEQGSILRPSCATCGRTFVGFISVTAGSVYWIEVDYDRGVIFVRNAGHYNGWATENRGPVLDVSGAAEIPAGEGGESPEGAVGEAPEYAAGTSAEAVAAMIEDLNSLPPERLHMLHQLVTMPFHKLSAVVQAADALEQLEGPEADNHVDESFEDDSAPEDVDNSA